MREKDISEAIMGIIDTVDDIPRKDIQKTVDALSRRIVAENVDGFVRMLTQASDK
jgi:hypothetical protein